MELEERTNDLGGLGVRGVLRGCGSGGSLRFSCTHHLRGISVWFLSKSEGNLVLDEPRSIERSKHGVLQTSPGGQCTGLTV